MSREWIQMFKKSKWLLGGTWDFPGCPQLRWSYVITKDLKYLSIRKELADKWVKWQMTIMPKKDNCKE